MEDERRAAARQRLIRAMNPPGKQAHSAETQALTLILHDLASDPPPGWSIGYAIADDLPFPDGRSNLDQFAEDMRANWERQFAARNDEDAADDAAAMPSSGHHVVIEITHEETGARLVRWIDREEFAAIVRQPGLTPKQRLAAGRAYVDAAVRDGGARVARRRARLAAAQGEMVP